MRPRELLGALCAGGVDYVLCGGLAAAMHGTTRVTADIDIVYATHSRNLERLCGVLNRFEPRRMVLGKPQGVLKVTPAILRTEPILQLSTAIGEVDLLARIHGFRSYSYVKKLSETVDVGFPVRTLGIEGLLRAKRAMKRPKDLQDIVELEAIREARALQS